MMQNSIYIQLNYLRLIFQGLNLDKKFKWKQILNTQLHFSDFKQKEIKKQQYFKYQIQSTKDILENYESTKQFTLLFSSDEINILIIHRMIMMPCNIKNIVLHQPSFQNLMKFHQMIHNIQMVQVWLTIKQLIEATTFSKLIEVDP
ncbi:unnamed protein product [Paramecium octaurelia]|uniref:Uncharacterized protein n=1 Tax=Paramecium octaurelia TaxID=43137 RepID=A0A8S1W8M5_PAROT|nr:unnamed protein product [Paramecium octaurelia]